MHTNLRKGDPIVASDGQELGTLKEVRGDYFKVNTMMAPDYWLPCSCVSGSGTDGSVAVTFAKDQLDHYRSKEPAGFQA